MVWCWPIYPYPPGLHHKVAHPERILEFAKKMYIYTKPSKCLLSLGHHIHHLEKESVPQELDMIAQDNFTQEGTQIYLCFRVKTHTKCFTSIEFHRIFIYKITDMGILSEFSFPWRESCKIISVAERSSKMPTNITANIIHLRFVD